MAVELRTGKTVVLGVMRRENREMRRFEIARLADWHGVGYGATCWAIGELTRAGVIERVCRGLYRLAPEKNKEIE